MRKLVGVMALAGMVGGCTSVRVLQREGCWVRQTSQWPAQVTEELGPCARPAMAWSNDRLTRLVQECMAQVDYRWQNQALAAWNRGEPLPERESEQSVLEACMSEASHAVVTENEALRTRLGEVSTDRDALRAHVEEAGEHLRANNERLTQALGKAAKKPPGSAVATATSTSEGSATTKSDSNAQTPRELVTAPPPRQSVPAARPVNRQVTKKPAVAPKLPLCEPAAAPTPPAMKEPSEG